MVGSRRSRSGERGRPPGPTRGAVLLVCLFLAVPGGFGAADQPTPPPGVSEASELTRLAMMYLHQGDKRLEGWKASYEAGIAAAEKAIELDPSSADAHYALFCNLGRQAERAGIAMQAFGVGRLRDLLERTVELDPRHAHAWAALGEMLLRLPWLLGGSVDEGREALERAAALAPGWYRPRLILAQHFHDEGEIERARVQALLAEELATAANRTEQAAAARRILERLPES